MFKPIDHFLVGLLTSNDVLSCHLSLLEKERERERERETERERLTEK